MVTLRVKVKKNSLFPVGLAFSTARLDHVRVKSSSCCFPMELVNFGPGHVTCSSPMGKRI